MNRSDDAAESPTRDDDIETQASGSRLPAFTAAATSLVSGPPTRPARPSLPPTKAPSAAGSATTVGSPLEALEHDEIMRTRWFCLIAIVIALTGGASVPLLPGDPTATVLLLSAIGVSLVAVMFLYNRTRNPVAFRKSSTGLGWFVPAACVTTAIPYYGVFSPVSLLLVLGIYFTGLGKSRLLSYAVYGVCAGMQAIIALLVILGWRDTGLIHPDNLTTSDQIVVQALVQAVMLATIVTARMSRRTTLLAVSELERAVRLAAHREALLLEAREELDRAMRQGRGRFSDQTIGGYHLGGLLGRGAMGEVYEATAPSGGAVAIKLLSQASLSNPTHVLRFLRELRTAAAVRSPHIVQVLEIGEHPVPYLVMERLEGMTLSELMRGRSRPLTAEEAVDLVAHVGEGITAAATAGIVHRDLKPQNVFLDRGVWKILDFGVARAMDQGDTLTAGQVVGTPSYMAPEQAMGTPVDHRTDLYALAAIAYRATTGHPPYAAGEVAETLYKVVHTKPRRPSEIVHLPPEIDLVLAIGMAKLPDQRFHSATEFTSALTAAFAGALPAIVHERGRILERAGAWAPPPSRARHRVRSARPPR